MIVSFPWQLTYPSRFSSVIATKAGIRAWRFEYVGLRKSWITERQIVSEIWTSNVFWKSAAARPREMLTTKFREIPTSPVLVTTSRAMPGGKCGSTGHICVISFQLIYVLDCKFDETAEVRFVGKGQAVNQDVHPAPLPFQLLERCLHLVHVLRDVR